MLLSRNVFYLMKDNFHDWITFALSSVNAFNFDEFAKSEKKPSSGVIKNLDCLVGPYVSDIYQTTEIWTRRMSKAFADNK